MVVACWGWLCCSTGLFGRFLCWVCCGCVVVLVFLGGLGNGLFGVYCIWVGVAWLGRVVCYVYLLPICFDGCLLLLLLFLVFCLLFVCSSLVYGLVVYS